MLLGRFLYSTQYHAFMTGQNRWDQGGVKKTHRNILHKKKSQPKIRFQKKFGVKIISKETGKKLGGKQKNEVKFEGTKMPVEISGLTRTDKENTETSWVVDCGQECKQKFQSIKKGRKSNAQMKLRNCIKGDYHLPLQIFSVNQKSLSAGSVMKQYTEASNCIAMWTSLARHFVYIPVLYFILSVFHLLFNNLIDIIVPFREMMLNTWLFISSFCHQNNLLMAL